jgi:hypothetical protein
VPDRHADFSPVHVAAALAVCEGFLAAEAGSAAHAASSTAIASVTIRMDLLPVSVPQHPRAALVAIVGRGEAHTVSDITDKTGLTLDEAYIVRLLCACVV